MQQRFRRYPVQAMERGWPGRAEIRMAIGATDDQEDARQTSSKYQYWMKQALDMVKEQAP